MRGHDDTGRDHSEIKAVNQVKQHAEGMSTYAANRDVELAAGMKAAASNKMNEGHLVGGAGEHGKSTNAIGDDVRDAARDNSMASGMAGYEEKMVAAQGVESKYLNPTMQQDAIKMDEGQQFAVQKDTQGREAGRSVGTQAEAPAPVPKDNTAHTAQAFEGGVGKILGGNMQNALASARGTGAIAALSQSGAKMGGGQNLFGDNGKGMSAPATPGQEAFTASKAAAAQQQGGGVGR